MNQDVTDHPEQSRFEIHVDGELAGFVQYRKNGEGITFLHAETGRRFRGQGVAGRLVKSALDQIPRCPYVRDWIEDHPDYAELVPAGRRAEFGL